MEKLSIVAGVQPIPALARRTPQRRSTPDFKDPPWLGADFFLQLDEVSCAVQVFEHLDSSIEISRRHQS